MQQGDPLAPLLFTLVVDPIVQTLGSPFDVWYLDDGTLARPIDSAAADLQRILPAVHAIGLKVNLQKCEITHLEFRSNNAGTGIIGNDAPCSSYDNVGGFTTLDTFFLNRAPTTPINSLSLLRASIQPDSTGVALESIKDLTKTLIERTSLISSHMALLFLASYASVPRVTPLMHAAPVYAYLEEDNLKVTDKLQWDATSHSCNVALDDRA